jgi:putative ABC transport system permease protein
VIPAFSASRTDPNSAMSQGTTRTGTGRTQAKARSFLVVAEISLALVLLIASALFIRTLVALRSVDPGFDAHNVVTTQTPLVPKLLKSPGVNQLIQNAAQRLSDLPGVEAAGLTTLLPLDGGFTNVPVAVSGAALGGRSGGFATYAFVSPNYFAAFKIPLLRGRSFTQADSLDGPPIAIINQAMAQELWRNGNAMGEQIIVGKGLGPGIEQPPRQIVGIVGNVRNNGLNLVPQPAVFIPSAQRPDTQWAGDSVSWVVRTRSQSASLDTEIQNTLRQATGLPVAPLRSMEDVIAQSTDNQSFNMLLMSIFAGCALLLAVIGIYGVMSYLVVQRTHEIGLRMALGAQKSDVVKLIVGEGFRLIMIGIAVGIVGALALTRFLSSLLFGIKPTDPLTFIAVSLIFIGVSLLACLVPARRAANVDPMVALRYE